MTIALLSHTLKQGTSAGSGTSSAIDTTGASLLVAFVADFTGSTASVFSDSEGNTWTGLTARPLTGNMRTRIYYCASPSTSASHTFQASGTSSFAAIAVSAYSGTAASPFDVENGATTLTATSLATGSVTPSEDNELLVFCAGYASSALTVDVGTMLDTAAIIGGTSYGIGMAYQIQTTATARSPSFSWSATNSCGAAIATFKAAASGTTVSGALGTATASGLTATVNANRTIAGTLGTATASGFQGTVANSTDTTIAGNLGTATASGFTGAVNANRTIAGALGTAVASGFQGTVSNTNDTIVTGTVGTATASGIAGTVAWNRTVAGSVGEAIASGLAGTVQSGDAPEVAQPIGGGGYLPSFRRKTRKEIHAERVRLGILPEQIRQAAQKVVEKAAEQGDPQEVYEDNTERYRAMFLREVGATKWAPDYARAIRIQLELMERDAEDALLLM